MEYNKLTFFGCYKTNTQLSNKMKKASIKSQIIITIDNEVSWKLHIRHIQTKVSKNISIMNKSKYILEYNCRYLLYCSLILPYLTYCIEIKGSDY